MLIIKMIQHGFSHTCLISWASVAGNTKAEVFYLAKVRQVLARRRAKALFNVRWGNVRELQE